MGKKKESLSINWYLILGAALHWSSMFYLGTDTLCAPLSDSPETPRMWPGVIIVAAMAVMAAATPRLLEKNRNRTVAIVLSIATGAASLLASLGADAMQWRYAAALFRAFSIGILVLLWGFAFASLDKRTAGRHAALCLLTTLCLSSAVLGIRSLHVVPPTVPDTVERLLSAATLLTGRIRFSAMDRLTTTSAAKVVPFYGSRIILGCGIGIGYTAAQLSRYLVPAALLLALCLVVAVRFLASGSFDLYALLPSLPLIAIGCLYTPFASSAGIPLANLASTTLWLLWIFVSSFQLSGLKETLGMRESSLGFSEKAALMLGWIGGIAAGPFVASVLGSPLTGEALVYAGALWATWTSVRTVYNRKEDAFIEALTQKRAERKQAAYRSITERYGLTKREREVFEMLAEGHTRPHICRELTISDGTARAHAFHVYQKLGVHKKDELLELVRTAENESGGIGL